MAAPESFTAPSEPLFGGSLASLLRWNDAHPPPAPPKKDEGSPPPVRAFIVLGKTLPDGQVSRELADRLRKAAVAVAGYLAESRGAGPGPSLFVAFTGAASPGSPVASGDVSYL